MRQVHEVRAIAGVGLESDRYALGKGAFSHSKIPKIRHVTFIGSGAIARANMWSGADFTPAETRRNIITDGIDVNELVDTEFWIGDVGFVGIEPCDPCDRPDKLSGKNGFKESFHDLGGLRAQIVYGGMLAVGQEIIV